MKTLISLTISVTGLKGFDSKDTGITSANPDLVFNLDEFKFDINHTTESTPEEYIEGIKGLCNLFKPIIRDLACPSAQVGKPSLLDDDMPDDVPDGHDCTHEKYHVDCGFCRARHAKGICFKCRMRPITMSDGFCSVCYPGGK